MDTALEALQKHIEQLEKENGIVRVPMPRDFVSCRWCDSRGCAACANARAQRKRELDEEYARQFPNGPQPMFSLPMETDEQIATARRVIGREVIEKAFGPNGRGVEEIIENAEREGIPTNPKGT